MGSLNSRYSEMRAKYIINVPPVKRIFKKSGFISYYFIHRTKIQKWNNQSDLILFKYLGAKMTLTHEFKNKLDVKFVTLLSKLKNHINILAKSGWKLHFISIYEYNIIVNFKKFYDRYYQVFKSEELVKVDFLSLEREFVNLTYRESYLDALFGVFEKYLITFNTHYMSNSEKFDELFFNLKLLFEKSSLPHSLRELILAYNVTELNGFYKWSDIFPPLTYDIVPDQWFDVDKEVYSELVSHFKNTKSSVKSLLNEKETILRIQSNCIINDNDSPPILVKFYQSNKHSWDLDKSNYYLLFLLVLEGLVSHLESFILREWKFIDSNEKLLSQRLIKDDDLPSLFRKLKREYDMAFVYFNADTGQSVHIDDFRAAEDVKTLANSEQQKRMNNSFKDILYIIFDISNRILAYVDLALESGYTKNTYLNFMLDAPPQWAGKPVFSLFNYYIELLWTTCGYFKHPKFVDMNERIVDIDLELERLNTEINRIDTFKILDGIDSED